MSGVALRAKPTVVATAVRADRPAGVAVWGHLPALSLTGALGLLLVALADTVARAGGGAGEPLFWAGLLTLFAPIAGRLASPNPARRERIGLVAILGCGLYLVKVLHSPARFTFYDELLHLRTLDDILRTGRLFEPNPLLPVSPLYPGLENVAAALVSLSGLSPFEAGVIVVGAARLLLVLALYLFYEEIGRSARVAGIATILYMTNPNFTFFDAQFGYESLALPLALLALAAAARRLRPLEEARRTQTGRAPAPAGGSGPIWPGAGEHAGLTLTIVLGLWAVVTTHHITTYALVALLIAWTAAPVLWHGAGPLLATIGQGLRWYAGWLTTGQLVRALREQSALLRRRLAAARQRAQGAVPGSAALLALVVSLTWLVYVASLTLAYFGGFFGAGVREVVRLIAREESGRQLFRGTTGQVAPLWEQLNGYSAVGLIVLALPFGLRRIARRHHHRPVALALAGGALAYLGSQTLRLTELGLQVAGRTGEFLFLALGFVLAIGIAQSGPFRRPGPLAVAAFTVWAAVIFTGGVILGWPRWARLPGPYLVAAETRSIEREGLLAAEWTRARLGRDNRIAADRINAVLLVSHGGQYPVTSSYDRVDVPSLFFAPDLGPAEGAILRAGQIRYVVVDRRLGGRPPLSGLYIELGEPGANRHTGAIDPATLAKFDGVRGIDRVFDSGNIVIYDVESWADAP